MLVDYIYRWAERWPQKQYDYISPSSLGGCMRSHFYKIKGVGATTPPNPGALLNFELGRLWEKPIEDALKHFGLPFISQWKITDEITGMQGTVDIVLVEPEYLELVSIKTEGALKKKYRDREGKNFFSANPEYAIQEAAYKLLLESQGFQVKDTARYIVITKDNGFIEEPVLSFSPELMKATVGRINKLRKYLDADELPPCECEGWKVNYCNYGDPDSIEKNKTGKMVPTRCCSKELYADQSHMD